MAVTKGLPSADVLIAKSFIDKLPHWVYPTFPNNQFNKMAQTSFFLSEYYLKTVVKASFE